MTDDSTSTDRRVLSQAEEGQLATFAQALAALATRAANGEADIDIELAALLAGAQDSVRTEAIKRFRSLVAEQRQAQGIDTPALSPEQQKQLEMARARERSFLANFLSELTLKKIREAILSNPLFFKQVKTLGEDLYAKGVLLDTTQSPQTGQQVTPPAVTAPLSGKGGRERV